MKKTWNHARKIYPQLLEVFLMWTLKLTTCKKYCCPLFINNQLKWCKERKFFLNYHYKNCPTYAIHNWSILFHLFELLLQWFKHELQSCSIRINLNGSSRGKYYFLMFPNELCSNPHFTVNLLKESSTYNWIHTTVS